MKNILILCATEEEEKSIKKSIRNLNRPFDYTVMKTGIGKLNAMFSVMNTHSIAFYSPFDYIFNIGLCGGLNCNIGDIFTVNTSLNLDYDTYFYNHQKYKPKIDLSSIRLKNEYKDVISVNCYSSDRFVGLDYLKFCMTDKIMNSNKPIIFDMELNGIAKGLNGKPDVRNKLVAIKGVSDNLNSEEFNQSLTEILDTFTTQAIKMITDYIKL